MKWSVVLIIIVTASIVVGPLMMMRPNPAQKRKENLRSFARNKGIHFALRKLPKQADEMESPEPLAVYFLPPIKTQNTSNWLLMRAHYEHELHFLNSWAWQGAARPSINELDILKECLPSLPQSIKAISSGVDGICVYWDEKGDEVVLQQIIELLARLESL
jgi:hypothetical protein